MNRGAAKKGGVGLGLVLALMGAVGFYGAASAQSATDGQATPGAPTSATVDLSGVWGPAFVYSLSQDPPSLPKTKKEFDALDRNNDPLMRCQPPGIPRLNNLAFLLEIVQTPKVVYFLYEYDHLVRRIFINGKHPDADSLIPTWLGNSIGHWEGRTLVVDTVGFKGTGSWLDMRGHQHSDALHIIERYTLSDDGQSLKQEVTVDDPKMYSKPWQSVPSVHKLRNDLQVLEYICEPSAAGLQVPEKFTGPGQ